MAKPKQVVKPKVQKVKKTNDSTIECEGVVIEVLPNARFKVKLNEYDFTPIVRPSGRMQTHKIKIIKGDHVKVELSTYNLTEGRITFRNRMSTTHLPINKDDENKEN
ncbi:translation initiation factor IF-1 [Spiroplasma endosymbiont of Notiophilus biguttatus]|uniref:translation initiation factor IF-1 n=1 Tax=Spiroplasma endosymbiont of Notiophilus biguttatus TaxID=3066285 RepID=UPI003CC7AB38